MGGSNTQCTRGRDTKCKGGRNIQCMGGRCRETSVSLSSVTFGEAEGWWKGIEGQRPKVTLTQSNRGLGFVLFGTSGREYHNVADVSQDISGLSCERFDGDDDL